MLDKFKEIIKGNNESSIKKPLHIAITLSGIESWASRKNVELRQAYAKSYGVVRDIIGWQVKHRIPVVTVYLFPEKHRKGKEQLSTIVDEMVSFFESLKSSLLEENHVKISVLGKWYDMPGRLVEVIKDMLETTKDYDGFFFNLCINYDGNEEIVDAAKLMARQVKAGKLDPEMISRDNIKDNLYSSSFLPPDVIIKSGKRKSSGLLLWDSNNAWIYFTDKAFPEFREEDFEDAVKSYK